MAQGLGHCDRIFWTGTDAWNDPGDERIGATWARYPDMAGGWLPQLRVRRDSFSIRLDWWVSGWMGRHDLALVRSRP